MLLYLQVDCAWLNIYFYFLDSYQHNINPFHPNISIYILHTVFHTFPKVGQGADKENLFDDQELL